MQNGVTLESTSMNLLYWESGDTVTLPAEVRITRKNLFIIWQESKEHSYLWNEDIFMLESFSGGHCHTYNPKNNSFAGNRGQFYAMLGT